MRTMDGRYNILLVDDDQVDRRTVLRHLERSSVQVRVAEAASTADALDKMLEESYDCVLLDHNLPDGDSTWVLSLVMQQNEAPPPIVILTGQGDESLAVQLMKAGATDYIPKSELSPERLSSAIRNAVRLWIQQREVKRTERELAERAEALTQSNAELSRFVHVASHDLREPLRKIQTFGERLSEEFGFAADGRQRMYLDRMTSAAQRMEDLINDLLTYSEVASRPDPFEAVSLEIVAQEVLDDLKVGIDEIGAQVEVGPLPVIDADAIQMRQLFQNLLGNALKFRRKDVSPVVRVFASRAGSSDVPDGMVQIIVADNGIGFDQKYAGRIFEFFQRLHTREEYEGTGVGLSICRKIAERHGGGIEAVGEPGVGATFVVTLPLNCAEGVSNVAAPREVAVEGASDNPVRGR